MNKAKDLITSYNIEFESALDNQDVRSCFSQYLTRTHNQESFLFLTELERFVTYVGHHARYKAAKKIIKEYLTVGAEKEINISNKLREEAVAKYNESNSNCCDIDLFSDIRVAIFMSLKDDCLSGFLSSDEFTLHVHKELKKNKSYLSLIGTQKTEQASQDPTPPPEVNECAEITDEDFNNILLRMRGEEEVWDTVYTSEQYTRSISRESSKGFKAIKNELTFPFDREEVFNITQCSKYSDAIDMEVFKYKRTYHQHIESGKYDGVVTHYELVLPFPINNRYFVSLSSAKKLPNGDILLISKSCNIDGVPFNKKHIKGTAMQGHLFEKTKKDCCKYTVLSAFNLGGFVAPQIVRKLHNTEAFVELIENARYERLSNEEEGPSPEHPIYKSLVYNVVGSK
ncbi:hypothetical protein AKO1_015197 [Acrasis kona]|uniref:Regulator of G-protein signaling n=1 Tax=Acrasis kona TaxID=1008807 RepID=A0AAW2ZH41_9EUKA